MSRVKVLSGSMILLAVVVLLLAGCVVAQPSASSQANGAHSQANGIHIHGETDRIVIGTPQLMCTAPLVMEVNISALGPGHWNTPYASRPPKIDAKFILDEGYAIYTPLHFAHMHIYVEHRHQPRSTIEFATIGGTAGPDSYDMGYPQVAAGGSYLLVLVPGTDPVAHAWTEKVYVVSEAFPIDAQGSVILQPAHTEGKGKQTEAFPAVTLPLSQIAQQLANCG